MRMIGTQGFSEDTVARAWRRMTFALGIACALASGCVLPGGDRPVGAMRIDGRVTLNQRSDWVGKEMAVVRRAFSTREQLDALNGIGDPACNPARRYLAVVDSSGAFSTSLPGFLSGEPIWIIPPLGSATLFGDPPDKQGLVFLLRTPPPAAKTYEIDVRNEFPRIRILKESGAGFRKLSDAERLGIFVTAETIRSNSPSGFSWNSRIVSIKLTP